MSIASGSEAISYFTDEIATGFALAMGIKVKKC
jgi:hypothetical protein